MRRNAQAEEMAKRGFITVAEAARRLRVHTGVIYRALARKKLDGAVVGTRKYVSEASFETYSNGWLLDRD